MDTNVRRLPITIVTGPRKSGRTTYAILVLSSLYQQGYDCLHNGTALFGMKYFDDYLNNPHGLLDLAKAVPTNTVILIEEADTHPATRRDNSPVHHAAVASAISVLEAWPETPILPKPSFS